MRKYPTIAHFDMDAFFASVEQLDQPSLVGRPTIVAGLSGRGVVSAASYEARAYGVHSGLPTSTARIRCPDGVYLVPRFDRYTELSAKMHRVLHEASPLVESLGLDEAFIDLDPIFGQLLPSADEVAEVIASLRAAIKQETGLNCSAGAGTSKQVAKMAGGFNKPNGQYVVPTGGQEQFLAPFPVSKLWGVGPATTAKLAPHGIETAGDLQTWPEETLKVLFGNHAGHHLYALVHGLDESEVTPYHERKSLSVERTLTQDVTDKPALCACIRDVVNEVVARLEHRDLVGKTITLRVRLADFTGLTRSHTRKIATSDSATITTVCYELLEQLPYHKGIRTIGVGLSNLSTDAQLMLPGFAPPSPQTPPSPESPPENSARFVNPRPADPDYKILRIGAEVSHQLFGIGRVITTAQDWSTVRFYNPPYRNDSPVIVGNAALEIRNTQTLSV